MRHGRLLFILIPFILSACGQNSEDTGGPKRWANFPVAIYTDSSLAQYNDSESTFEEAMGFWEQKAGKKLFDFKGTWNGGTAYSGDPLNPTSVAANVIQFLNPWNYDYSIAAQTVVLSKQSQIQHAIIFVNPNTMDCYWSCTSELKVFTHELGHFLGLTHSNDTQNIMYPEIQPGDSIDTVTIDQATFAALVN